MHKIQEVVYEYNLLKIENKKLVKENKDLTHALGVATDELKRADDYENELNRDIQEVDQQLIECLGELKEYTGDDYEKYIAQIKSNYNKGRV